MTVANYGRRRSFPPIVPLLSWKISLQRRGRGPSVEARWA